MSALLSLVATNAATAAALALLAWAAGRALRRPAVVHGLWLLALAKLVTPPVLPMAVLPAWSAAAGAAAGPVAVPIPPAADKAALPSRDAASFARLDLSPARPPAPVDRAVSGRRAGVAHGAPLTPPPPARASEPASGLPSPGAVAAALLGLGSIVVTAVAWLRARRFGALLGSSSAAPDALAARADELARRLGLRGAPPVRLTPGPVPPMLWPTRRGPLLVLPARLLTELSDDERDALLAHELAHVRRRDHWVRFVELAATALFWWYPVAWWARRALRRAEERCCDEWVLRVLPSSAGAYANGLLKSVAFVAGEPLVLPAAASGAGPVEDLEARLKEILMTRPMPRLAAPVRLALGVAAAAGLAVFPTHAASRTADASAAVTATTPAAQPAAAPRPAAAPALVPRPARAVAGPADVARATATPRPSSASASAGSNSEPAVVGGITGGVAGGALGGISGGVLAAGTPLPDLAAPADDEDPALASERRAIEEQRRALRAQEIELERRTLALEAKAIEQRFAGETARLRAEGRDRDAQRVEKQLRLERRHLDLQEQQLRLEVESTRIEAKVERAGADEAAVAEVEAARDALEKKQRALEADMEAMAREIAAADAEARVDALHESTGELERSIAEHIESLRQALPEAGSRQPEIEHEMKRLQSALDALGARPGATRMKVRTTAPPERTRQPAPESSPATAPRR